MQKKVRLPKALATLELAWTSEEREAEVVERLAQVGGAVSRLCHSGGAVVVGIGDGTGGVSGVGVGGAVSRLCHSGGAVVVGIGDGVGGVSGVGVGGASGDVSGISGVDGVGGVGGFGGVGGVGVVGVGRISVGVGGSSVSGAPSSGTRLCEMAF